jgi:hypothetical protein
MTFLIELGKKKKPKIPMNHKGHQIAKTIVNKRAKWKESQFLNSRQTMKPQESKQHGTDIKTDTQTSGTK